jgi:hypothetical protein
MSLKDFMAISGQSGLFKYVSQGRNGIIVESLIDKRRTHVSASAKVSALSDIAVFTNDGEVSLGEVLEKIKVRENGGKTISHKSPNDDLKNFFIEVLPEYDEQRVYISDIKKIVTWYNQLQEIDAMDFIEKNESEEVKDASDNQTPADESDDKVEQATITSKASDPKKVAKTSKTEKKPAPKKSTAKPKSTGVGTVKRTAGKKV